MLRAIRFLLPALLAVTPALAQPPRGATTTPEIVSTEWLAARLDRPGIVVLHVGHEREFAAGRIPGAREVPYMSLVAGAGGLSSELPPADSLRSLFERLGVSDASQVVVYGSGPMMTRALFTLAYLGHEQLALLDGGLEAWRAEGRPVESRRMGAIERGRMTAPLRPELVVTADWILDRLDRPGLALIDTRTDGEYLGTGNRSGMPSHGHLAGARQLEWEALFEPGSAVRLKPRAELERLFADRVRPGDTVVTYCWVGYRASATWFLARVLGYDARLYDGSYQDWQRRSLPARAGASP